jgi:hypothetical protein
MKSSTIYQSRSKWIDWFCFIRKTSLQCFTPLLNAMRSLTCILPLKLRCRCLPIERRHIYVSLFRHRYIFWLFYQLWTKIPQRYQNFFIIFHCCPQLACNLQSVINSLDLAGKTAAQVFLDEITDPRVAFTTLQRVTRDCIFSAKEISDLLSEKNMTDMYS